MVPLPKEPRKRKAASEKWPLLYRLLAVGLVGLVVGLVIFITALRHRPTFYVKATAPVEATLQAQQADRFERSAIELNSRVRREGMWQSRFTEVDINSFLAADLARKFPGTLPSEVKEPRVHITTERMEIAFHSSSGLLSGVVVAGIIPKATDKPGEIALTLEYIRLGRVPMPLKPVMDQITQGCQRANLPLRWEQESGKPVALLTLPTNHPDLAGYDLVVEQLQLEEGAIVLSGRTSPTP